LSSKITNKLRNNLLFNIACVLIIVMISYTIISFLTTRSTLGLTQVEVWDGTTVASSFSGGNGSETNPYQISNGPELAYFKDLIEGTENATYADKYYVLTNDIDLGDHEITSIGSLATDNVTVNMFKGHLDGASFTIKNFQMNAPKTISNINYYGLFALTLDANIENLNISNVSITPSATDGILNVGILAGKSSNTIPDTTDTTTTTTSTTNQSKFMNISIQDAALNLTNTTANVDSKIGGLVGYLTDQTSISNTFIKLTYNTDYIVGCGKLVGTLDANIHDVVSLVTNTSLLAETMNNYSTTATNGTTNNIYEASYTNSTFTVTRNNENVTNDTLLSNLNDNLNAIYTWTLDNDLLKITKVATEEETSSNTILTLNSPALFTFSTQQAIAVHASGISGDTVYVNDLTSDTNYYYGKNYTDSTNGTLPTTENKNLYNTNTLVEVHMSYSGTDLTDNTLTGYVSLTEQQSKYIYYKYYPVSNGYVTIELIDNPFSNHPTDKAFNGWVTDYTGATITYDSTYYTRSIKIPVTYTSGVPDTISISLNASWIKATAYQMTTANDWDNAFGALNSAGMHPTTTTTNLYEDMSAYYITGTISYYNSYPTGAVDAYGNDVSGNYCYTWRTDCTYYIQNTVSTYNSGTTYYELSNGYMIEHTPTIVGTETSGALTDGTSAAGYYRSVSIPNGASLTGYYDSTGNYQSSGTCNDTTCTYYELIQYYDTAGNENLVNNATNTYYYLVTRDTNIIVLRANTSNTWSSSNTKPFTLTSIYNGNDYRSNYFNVQSIAVKCYADTTIENVYIRTTRSYQSSTTNEYAQSGNSNSYYLYGNWHNVKVGRGLTHYNNYVNFDAFIGGSNGDSGSSSNITKFRLMVESGHYNVGAMLNGSVSDYYETYTEAQAIFGNDYDRVNANNDNFIIYNCLSNTWGGSMYSSSEIALATDAIYKSGSYGSSKQDNITGIYVGGRQGGTIYAARRGLIEGGWFYNVIGGPITADNRTNYNDSYIYIKGGEVGFLWGGAGRTATYGNRIIQFTDGTVDYSIFGGSNASSGSNGDGTVNGTSYVYVGGNALVGDPNSTIYNRTLYNAESGSIFGNGCGKSGSSTIGSNDNAIVILDGNATVTRNVYGGGNFGATGVSSSSTTTYTKINMLGGTVNGSIYGGGNNNGSGTTAITSTINITMNAGTVKGSIFGGSRTTGTIYGSTNVKINGGNVATDVYGGGEGNNTYVSRDSSVVIGDTANTLIPTIDNSVYGGSAFGTVNGTTHTTTLSTYTTKVTVNKGVITNSVFGGGKGSSSYTPYVEGDVTVTINDGNIGNVFGGCDAAGVPNGSVIVYLNGGTIGNAYGGGNSTPVTTSDIYLQGSNVTYLFGGSNQSGTVPTSNVHVTSGTVTSVYGGNNSGGTTTTSNVTITGSTISGPVYGGGKLADTGTTNITITGMNLTTDVYGGGESADVTTATNVNINGTSYANIFGGSNQSGTVAKSNVNINSGSATNVFGGNNHGGTTTDSNVNIYNGTITNAYGGGNEAETTTTHLNVYNGTITAAFGGGNAAGATTTNVNLAGGTITNAYGGSNQSGTVATSNVVTTSTATALSVTNIYGGNNMGGTTTTTNVTIPIGNITNVFGGGNQAVSTNTNITVTGGTIGTIYGGGNEATVDENTNVNLANATITNNIYGGGNEGMVKGNTNVLLNSITINGSAYAGGNGSTAVVNGNTTITVEGNTVIGTTTSVAPSSGCLFGSGNAAATGTAAANNSVATVNIVGATIYGNVYGGANTSVVYGTTNTNIGTKAVNDTSLTEGNVNIIGTIFGGGEANASGSETYDFSFICVTVAIHINIDGTDYATNSHTFTMTGSIFGSGDASSSSGTSDIKIKALGTKTNVSKNISIQRSDSVVIDNSYLELKGATDRTNEYSSIKYSFNRIDSLTIKNNTTLLLQQNANLLKEWHSMVDVNGTETAAVVTIADDGSSTKNVDNRLYMLVNKDLNVTTNENATAYGKVEGMTFFGMYNEYSNGSISYAMYDSTVNNGDAADAGDQIIGGSYVLGLHSTNHDIKKDGFYTNYLNDAFTAIKTDYIHPTPSDANYYIWSIGIESIKYSFSLTASKYSSLGTYELSMIDFAKGDTIFNVVGFNSEGLTSGVNIVDSNNVPKIATSEEAANSTLGLSMKSETTEWTSYGTTKFLSANNGSYTGTTNYKTDSEAKAPSMMFYLYHAKNITLNADLGTVIITLQALTPKNEIEYNVNLVTITVTLDAKNYGDGNSYDASITYGRKYEMPSATSVNITNKSQFTAYYSLFATATSYASFYGNNNNYFHCLVSNYNLPVGTTITMIDNGISETNPQYYYYTVTSATFAAKATELSTDNQATYRLSDFIKMDSTSTNNTYNDATSNQVYYDTTTNTISEEFIFIVDFKNTSITGNQLNKTLLFELHNSDNYATVMVLGIRQPLMTYNLYESSNLVLQQTVNMANTYLYPSVVDNIDYTATVAYDQTSGRESVINTNYEAMGMGLNVAIYDSSNTQISSSLLKGTTIKMGGTTYYVDSDGVFKIKLAGKVANLTKKLYLTTSDDLPPGTYTMKYILFASPDGLHNSESLQNSEQDITIHVVGSNNAITVKTLDTTKLVDGTTCLNEAGTNTNTYTVKYTTVLTHPNVRLSIYKRNTDTKDTTSYTEVDFNSLFTDTLVLPTAVSLTPSSSYEKMLTVTAGTDNTITFTLANPLTSGTYKLVFKLYDNNQVIEDVNQYVIVKKAT
jgi:hypothetical protein